MVALEIIITMATKEVINISHNKAAAVSYIIIDISAILRSSKLTFNMKMSLYSVSSVCGCKRNFGNYNNKTGY